MLVFNIITLLTLAVIVEIRCEDFAKNIQFYIYPATGPKINYGSTDNSVTLGCIPNGLWAFVIHGWLGSTSDQSPWVSLLTSNLTKYRGGCIIAMDYSYYASNPDYLQLVEQFEGILGVFNAKINQFLGEGFSVSNGYMFGFSFGAHLIYHAGTKLGGKIPRIDTCEPAGPGFDLTPRKIDSKGAGINVQCTHTSTDAGTTSRDCHQDWLMGYCGMTQPAVGPPPKTNHGLCPYIYTSAFENTFLAQPDANNCELFVGNVSTNYPSDLRMGYMDSARLSVVRGTLFSPTYRTNNFAAPH